MEQAIRIKIRQLAILFTIAVLIYVFGLSSTMVERFYSDGLYQFTSVSQRLISSVLPFALGDFLYLLLVIFCLFSVWKVIGLIFKKQLDKKTILKTALQFAKFLLLVYIIFKILWGLNYSRPSITGRLGINDQKYTTKDLVALGNFLIKRVNKIKASLPVQQEKKAYTTAELAVGSKKAYDKMVKINPFFNYRSPALKPVLFSWLITKIGIEGYYCPPSGEANVNMRLPEFTLPFVSCHEISHQLGIAREDEANLIGYMVSTNSSDPYFQYSGNYNILRSVLFEIRMKSPEDFEILYKKINAGTIADFQKEREFWAKYNGDMSAYMNVALDKFLKINNQVKGTDSYQDIVLWVFNLHRKELKNN